ncbi:MAG: 50S ribosomal protein L11 methyltransferase [Blastomonas sp.]
MPDSWKVTLPCTLEEAQAAALDSDWEDGPTIVASENDPYDDPETPGSWRIDAYFAKRPGKLQLKRLADMAASAAAMPSAEKLPDSDWLTMSQAGLEPIRTSRFHVHTPETEACTEPGIRNFTIPAGLAFGTGHHETTHGCLEMLGKLRGNGHIHRNIIDIGTGTGLLAFAAMHLWPGAYASASDIDPLCDPVVTDNAMMNHVRLGQLPGQLAMFIADGLDDANLLRRAPYDLIIANILAGPLIDMARDIAAVATPQASVILAGLLNEQAPAVLRAYRRAGFRPARRLVRGDWTILHLRKRGWE